MSDNLALRPGSAIPGIGAAAPSGAAAGTSPSPEFRRLLESLEKLTRPAASASTERGDAATEQLQTALRKADDDFAAAMDLRRRLEEAFQARRR